MENIREKELSVDLALGITQERSNEIFEMVMDALCESESVSETIKKLTLNFELTNQELVFAAYKIGFIRAMDDGDFVKMIISYRVKKAITKILKNDNTNQPHY